MRIILVMEFGKNDSLAYWMVRPRRMVSAGYAFTVNNMAEELS
jgi:hypothetical protein